MQFVDMFVEGLGNRKHTEDMLCDLYMAFNLIDHKALLDKWNAHVVQRIPLLNVNTSKSNFISVSFSCVDSKCGRAEIFGDANAWESVFLRIPWNTTLSGFVWRRMTPLTRYTQN